MRFLIKIARAYPSQTLGTLAALLVAGILQGLSLSVLLPVLNLAMQEGEPTTAPQGGVLVEFLGSLGISPSLGVLLSVIVLGMSLKSILVLVANRQVGYTVAQIATDLRLRLLRALLDARWDYYLHQPIGSLSNAMATETSRAAGAYLSSTRTIARAIETLVYVIVALLVSWQATLIALSAGLLVMLGLGFLIRASRRAGSRQTKLLRSLLGRLTDMLQSVKALKSMGLEGRANAVLEAETGRLNRALRRQVFSHEALQALYELVVIALISVGLFFAVTAWELPLANVMVLTILLVRVLGSLGKVQRHYQKLVTDESAYWSLLRTIRSAEKAHESASTGRRPQFEREIVLEGIHFAYGSKQVLRGLSLTLPVGSSTTLIGPSGSGKTTVVDIITGLLKPSQGRALLDGVSLEECNLEQWRRMIGYVPQDTLLLHDTVLHNVTLGDPDLGEAEAENALRAAGAWDFVAATPEGLGTIVGERGSKLSGGQRQRLCIARALVRRPSLLILDEATSALDPQSEQAICETLAALRGKLTILAISHQSGLAAIADRILRLEDGRLQPSETRVAQLAAQEESAPRPVGV